MQRAAACCIAETSVEEIDRLNILQATMFAMQRGVAGLQIVPELVQIDGNRTPQVPMRAEAIVKSDAKVTSRSGVHLGQGPPRPAMHQASAMNLRRRATGELGRPRGGAELA